MFEYCNFGKSYIIAEWEKNPEKLVKKEKLVNILNIIKNELQELINQENQTNQTKTKKKNLKENLFLSEYLFDINEILQMLEQNNDNEISFKFSRIKQLVGNIVNLESKNKNKNKNSKNKNDKNKNRFND